MNEKQNDELCENCPILNTCRRENCVGCCEGDKCSEFDSSEVVYYNWLAAQLGVLQVGIENILGYIVIA